MKKIFLFLTVSLLLSFEPAFTQNCPPNIDFELGDLSNWECFTGTTFNKDGKNIISLVPSAPIPGRHDIISSTTPAAVDHYGKFPQLCPYGGKYSVKLGNASVGAEAEGLSYTFKVPSTVDTFSFNYFYAVVFQDPNHMAIEQPRFFVTAYDVESGALINCASYDYISNGAIPGFKVSTVQSDVLYKSWSPVSIQFSGLADRTVRLEFKTADCTLGGHFGYVYVDVGAACSNVLATAPYCIETNSLVLNAPYGFQTYTWYNSDYSAIIGNQQSLTLSPPPAKSGTYHVDIVPYPSYGCRDTADAIITPLPIPDTPIAVSDYYLCQLEQAKALTATSLPDNDLIWYSAATGGIGNSASEIPSTLAAGTFTYYVSQKTLFGCESFRKKISVTVYPTPMASFLINTNRQCLKGNQFRFVSTSTNLNSTTYIWNFGDGQTKSSTDSITNYSYTTYGTYNVTLKVLSPSGCFTVKTLTVTVVPNPVAQFNHPAVICEKQTPVLLTDNSSVPGGLGAVNNWWWNVNGAETISRNPNSFSAESPGRIPVKLVVASTNGCRSDTNTTILFIRYRPDAALKHSALLCDNEIIQFTDLSAMHADASSEYISKWYWKFDNSNTSSQQNPSKVLTAGVQHARLIVESNYGCKSIEADSVLAIQPKPRIALEINDSCVFRTIRYQAIDSLRSVSSWYWNLGNGLSKGVPMITRTYNTEGYRPLTIIAQTVYGCKDTVIRPFTIYDNKALAGTDTVAAKNEPVQLDAHGGVNLQYVWSPAIGLNDAAIENPVATLDRDQLYHLDAVTDKGCDSHSKIFIKRYKGPELYIPTAFTPNSDGVSDLLKVFPVGIKAFGFFAVYNRYGQQVYKTTDYSQGWDGIFNGRPADQGTYIAVCQAIDYKGEMLRNKTAVILVR